MRLYLVRHGEANTPDQSLTEVGREESAAVATHLKSCAVSIDEILHSTKLRAKQTAEIMGSIIAPDVALIEREGLKPNDPVAPFIEEITTFDRDVMVVGHLPFLEHLLTMLIYKEETLSPISLTGSCVVCLEGEGEHWFISWVVSPSLVLSKLKTS